MKKLLMALALALTLSSCSRFIGDFTILSPKNYESNQAHDRVGSVEGKHTVLSSIFLIPLPTNPDIEQAAYDALDEAPGSDHLRNVRMKSTNLFFIVFGLETVKVAGEAYRPQGLRPDSTGTVTAQ